MNNKNISSTFLVSFLGIIAGLLFVDFLNLVISNPIVYFLILGIVIFGVLLTLTIKNKEVKNE